MQPFQLNELQQARSSADPVGAGPASDRSGRSEDPAFDRLRALGAISVTTRHRTEALIDLARRGLPGMHRRGAFAHTMRAVEATSGRSVRREGDSLRSQAVVALGLACLQEEAQRQILGGYTAAELARISATRAEFCRDFGAIAVAVWAAAEAAGIHCESLLRRLGAQLSGSASIATSDCAWMLTAAVAAGPLGDTSGLAELAARRLLAAQGASGLFPHTLPVQADIRTAGPLGGFADQIFPIQALARFHASHGDKAALAAADACADRICRLQGPNGQWWWCYDICEGAVAKRYPIYSANHYALGPMALLDLQDAGGAAHWDAVIRGMEWLDLHPETDQPLISQSQALIWRKTTRRFEPLGVLSAARRRRKPRLSWLDRLPLPSRVTPECRPYELGWLLYAWLWPGPFQRRRFADADGRTHPEGGE